MPIRRARSHLMLDRSAVNGPADVRGAGTADGLVQRHRGEA
jgi:hypothetical protein